MKKEAEERRIKENAAREKQRIDKLEEERIERNRAAALKERSLIYWTNPHDQGNYRSIHSEEYQSRYKKKKYEYYQKQRRYMKLTETTVKTITSKYRDI